VLPKFNSLKREFHQVFKSSWRGVLAFDHRFDFLALDQLFQSPFQDQLSPITLRLVTRVVGSKVVLFSKANFHLPG
jgi:hypothetical protein